MRVTESLPSRDPVVEGRGGSVGVTLGVETEPNFLVCVIDDAGIEWFSQYYEKYGARWNEASPYEITDLSGTFTLPWFEQMADAGLLFYDMSAGPICGPTRTGINTGRYGFRHGHDINIRDPGAAVGGISPANYAVPATETFLAEYIKQKKPHYATGEFGKHHMCDHFSVVSSGDIYGCPTLAPNVNLTHSATMGFDYYDIHPANIGGNYTYWRIKNGTVSKIQGDATATFDETTYPTAVYGASALSWITAQGNNPWFAYVAFGPPHALFRVPPYTMFPTDISNKLFLQGLTAGSTATGTVNTSTGMYYNWIASLQASCEGFRRIYEGLTPEVRARTYVIITGDNGTTSEAIQTGFNHSKRQIYWGGTRVPFVVAGPGIKNPGERVHCIAAVQDIFDTITDLLGVARASSTRDSVSLVPLMQGRIDRTDPNGIRDYVYVGLGTNNLMNGVNEQWAVYDGRYRTGLMAGGSTTIMTDEYEDPFETTDVSADNETRKDEMEAYKVSLVGY